jgi:DNA-binding MarR family transcriptional regulator
MIASSTGVRPEELAQALFGVFTRFALARPRGRGRKGALKEAEYLTLSILHQHETRIVGDIQRRLGVLPAQMSRIIRSLEGRPQPLICCRINPQDKRKIDVNLTPAGERALLDYQTLQIQSLADVVRLLPDDDQDDLGRLLDKLHDVLERPMLS